MSEEENENSVGEESTEASTTITAPMGRHSMLTRDSDVASRPGFRNPSNTRSKVQTRARKPKLKLKRKKGKKKR